MPDSPLHGAGPGLTPASRLKLSGAGHEEDLNAAIERAGTSAGSLCENMSLRDCRPSALSEMTKGKPKLLGGASRKDVTAYAFGAHFVELRIHSRTREMRVQRVVSAFAAGTIVNAMTAHSQFMGGAIWGLSSALLEETEIDGEVRALRQ